MCTKASIKPCSVPSPVQVEKILQLHLACEQRIGVIIVGPSGSGKSTLWGVLEKVHGVARPRLLGCHTL